MIQRHAPVPQKAKAPILRQTAMSAPVSPAVTPPATFDKSDPRLPSLLDSLLEDCVLQSLDPKLLCRPRAEYVKLFHKFLMDRHCHENLSFLIEIFRYKYFYDQISSQSPLLFDDSKPQRSLFKQSFLNQSLDESIESIPFPSHSIRRAARRLSHSRSNSVVTNLGTSSPFPFEFEDDTNLSSANAWDALKESYLADDDDSSLSSSSSSLKSCSSTEKELLLRDQWHMIVSRFIIASSPEQVNICASTEQEILNANEDSIVHPSVLENAKHEVVELLRENAYGAFIRSQAPTSCSCSSAMASLGGSNGGKRHTHSNPRKEIDPSTLRDNVCLPLASSAISGLGWTSRQSKSNTASPPTHTKKKNKLLSHLSGSFEDVSSSSLSLSGLMNHFKHHSKSANSPPPQASNVKSDSSASNSEDDSPVLLREPIQSPSLLDKLLKKKRTP